MVSIDPLGTFFLSVSFTIFFACMFFKDLLFIKFIVERHSNMANDMKIGRIECEECGTSTSFDAQDPPPKYCAACGTSFEGEDDSNI